MVMVLMTTLSLSTSESLSYCVPSASQSQQQPIQNGICNVPSYVPQCLMLTFGKFLHFHET